MGQSLDIVLTVGAIIIGLMLITGNGGMFLRGGNEQLRRERYDEEKMAKGAGVAFILAGIATGISMFFETSTAKAIYVVVLALIFAGMFYYIKTKCGK